MKKTKMMSALALMAMLMLSTVMSASALSEKGEVRAMEGNGSLGIRVNRDVQNEGRIVPIDARLKADAARQKERSDDDREKYEEKREKLNESKKHYNESRKELIEVRAQFNTCKKSGNCSELERTVQVKSTVFLENAADRVINLLEKIKARMNESENLDESVKVSLIAQLDADILEMADLKADVEAFNESTTRAEIKAAAESIKAAWLKAKITAKIAVHTVIVQKLDNALDRFDAAGEKTQAKIDALTDAEYNTTAMAEAMASFNAELASAEAQYALAQQALIGATGDAALDEAKAAMDAAKHDLREAHGYLKKAIKMIAQARESEGDDETDDNETEDAETEGNEPEEVEA